MGVNVLITFLAAIAKVIYWDCKVSENNISKYFRWFIGKIWPNYCD